MHRPAGSPYVLDKMVTGDSTLAQLVRTLHVVLFREILVVNVEHSRVTHNSICHPCKPLQVWSEGRRECCDKTYAVHPNNRVSLFAYDSNYVHALFEICVRASHDPCLRELIINPEL